VASHPDACGVEQALALLDRVPEVEHAAPHMVLAVTENGDLLPVLTTTRNGSTRPCPSGTGLLK
jgi:hypothetical protein